MYPVKTFLILNYIISFQRIRKKIPSENFPNNYLSFFIQVTLGFHNIEAIYKYRNLLLYLLYRIEYCGVP
jgi:hypothetical protein